MSIWPENSMRSFVTQRRACKSQFPNRQNARPRPEKGIPRQCTGSTCLAKPATFALVPPFCHPFFWEKTAPQPQARLYTQKHASVSCLVPSAVLLSPLALIMAQQLPHPSARAMFGHATSWLQKPCPSTLFHSNLSPPHLFKPTISNTAADPTPPAHTPFPCFHFP